MNETADRLHYLRIPGAVGGRAEMVRMTYVLAGRPYVDVLHPPAQAAVAVTGKNPFKQFPFVETPTGQVVFQTLAIMHHAAHGTPAWPSEPARLTQALALAMGAYDLYQAFGGFPASDAVAKEKFEQKKAPQFFGALGELYGKTPFAAGETPCFADCLAYEALTWCARRNDVARALLEASPALVAFRRRFEELPPIRAFLARQAEARAQDNAV